jgi:hypothetical protein
MERFIGKWKNSAGNILDILPNDQKSVKVTFYSGITFKPVKRPFFGNKESIDMYAELDVYETSLEVRLSTNEKGFFLVLLHDWMVFRNNSSGYCLAPGITSSEDDDYIDRYGDLFMPLDNYKRFEE